ncbi:hypothetical protein CPB86DRAFT_449293 [Serendipita vermifera]|nr:hypothetical protein CPB86DRAFT_449293 [Serendipita vermifera]
MHGVRSHLFHVSRVSRREIPLKIANLSQRPAKFRLNSSFRPPPSSEQATSELDSERLLDVYCQRIIDEGAALGAEPLPAVVLNQVFMKAKQLNASLVARAVASDFLRLPSVEISLGRTLLEAEEDSKFLTGEQVHSIYERLYQSEGHLDMLNLDTLIYLGHLTHTEPTPSPRSLDIILTSILERWPNEVGVGHEDHLKGTWAIFSILTKLVKLDPELGKQRFEDLLRAKSRWPLEATTLVDGIYDQSDIVSIFILQCCSSWRWWDRAYSLAHELISIKEDDHHRAAALSTVLNRLMNADLDANGSNTDLRRSASLICSVASHPSLPPVESMLLRRFYKSCVDAIKPQDELASRIYLHLRSQIASNPKYRRRNTTAISTSPPDNYDTHRYLPPLGRAMVFLLKYYHRSNNHHAAKQLVDDLQLQVSRMPSVFLSTYLKYLIRLSFSTEARAVYTLCTTSPLDNVRAIASTASVARPLASLFVSLANKAHTRTLVDGIEDDEEARRAIELMDFARTVARQYRNSCSPFERSSHQQLTTLARISFETGYFDMGMLALKSISRRKDIVADTHDFNVILHTMATGDTQAAIELLDFMIQNGLEPDESMYGVVAAQCFKQNDFKLGLSNIMKAESRGRSKWHPKLLGAICWHGISEEALYGLDRKNKALRLQSLLRMLGPSGAQGEKIFRERTLGVRAANVALSIGRPDIALKFWERCINFHTIITQSMDSKEAPNDQPDQLLRSRILKELQAKKMEGVAHLSHQKRTFLASKPGVTPVQTKPRRLNQRGRPLP